MKERCRDGCRTSLLIAGVVLVLVLVLAIFHTSLPLCHPYITIHFMEMIFSTCFTIKLLLLFLKVEIVVKEEDAHHLPELKKDYEILVKQLVSNNYTN